MLITLTQLKSCLATTQRVQELWIKMTSFTGGTIVDQNDFLYRRHNFA
jgi:hypothetical protein